MSFPPVEEQLAKVLRGIHKVETHDELRKKLERSRETGKPLRIKLGIDPTGFDVHLGHTVVLRKLRQFQDLGHQVVLIIGTATAAVGDPSGRDESRKSLTPEQIARNAETYLTQIAKVIDVSRAEVVRNGDWFDRFTFGQMLRLLGSTTIQRMMERDDFSNRIKAATPIYLHECLYPLMQGWDSVEIRSDVELGGTEQLYNLMVGRDLQRDAGQEAQIALTMPILRGTDGVKKMGKTAGNYIGLNEPPRDQFGKTMRIPDELLREWFTLLTDRPTSDVDRLLAGHLGEAKKTLATDIVRCYHGEEVAAGELRYWNERTKGLVPQDIDEVQIPAADVVNGEIPAVDLIVKAGLCKSKNEARQKITEGAFNHGPDRTKVTDVKATVAVTDGLVVRLGRKILRVRLK